MNSSWHLIFPSLLIWLSAGICTVIHTTKASRLALHTLWCFTPSPPWQIYSLRMLIVHAFYRSITCMSSITQLWLFSMAAFYHFSDFAFTLLPVIVPVLTPENTCGILLCSDLWRGVILLSQGAHLHTNTHTHSLNQFVPPADEEVIYPPLKAAKKKGRD